MGDLYALRSVIIWDGRITGRVLLEFLISAATGMLIIGRILLFIYF